MIYGPRHISNAYASKFKIFLHQLFAFAVKESYLSDNPAEKLEIAYRPSEGGSSTRNKFLEADELNKLLEYAYDHNHNYATLCEWLYQTECCGEALALDVKDIEKQVMAGWFTSTAQWNIPSLKCLNGTKPTKQKRPPECAMWRYPSGLLKSIMTDTPMLMGRAIYLLLSITPIQISAFNTFCVMQLKR